MIIGRYITLNFVRGGSLVMLLLLALFTFLNLAEALEDVGKGSYTTTDAVSTVVLTTPALIIELLPIAALLGSVLGLGAMANQRELVALRASGMSIWHLARILGVIAAGLSVIALALMFLVVPAAERKAQEFRSHTLEQTALGGTAFWSRREHRVIRVGGVDFGRIPRAIEIYELNDNGRLSKLLTAERALILDTSTWRLEGVTEKIIEDHEIRWRTLENRNWESFLTADQVSTLITPADALSAVDLVRYLRESKGSGVDTRQHQTLLWRQLSLPLALFAMVLLGLPMVINTVRARSAGYRMLLGGAIGIGFYLFEQIASHLAVVLQLPPAATALTPASLILVAALAALRRAG